MQKWDYFYENKMVIMLIFRLKLGRNFEDEKRLKG